MLLGAPEQEQVSNVKDKKLSGNTSVEETVMPCEDMVLLSPFPSPVTLRLGGKGDMCNTFNDKDKQIETGGQFLCCKLLEVKKGGSLTFLPSRA